MTFSIGNFMFPTFYLSKQFPYISVIVSNMFALFLAILIWYDKEEKTSPKMHLTGQWSLITI